MIKILAISSLILLSVNSYSCIIDPMSRNAQDAESALKYSDIAFQGKLIEFNDFVIGKQVVTFEVFETFKGPELKNVVINNHLYSSCSRMFYDKGAIYYVFATQEKETGSFHIKTSATFFPQSMAVEYNVKMGGGAIAK